MREEMIPTRLIYVNSLEILNSLHRADSHIHALAAPSSSRKEATTTLLDISISQSNFVTHSSNERLRCDQTKVSAIPVTFIGHMIAYAYKSSCAFMCVLSS